VDLGRVLDNDHRVAFEPAVAELADRSGAVDAESVAKVPIDPGSRDHARTVLRADIALVPLDDRVDLVRRQKPFLDEDGLERCRTERELVVVVVVVATHAGVRYVSNRSSMTVQRPSSDGPNRSSEENATA
jgi:hypothetical protein